MGEITITQGKRDFTKIIQRLEEQGETIVTRRGEPVAAIVAYKQFQGLKRLSDWMDMLKIAEKMRKKGVKAKELHEISRRELEKRCALS